MNYLVMEFLQGKHWPTGMMYDAFFSYSNAADSHFVAVLRRGTT